MAMVGMVGNGNSNGNGNGGPLIDTRNVGSKNKISSNGGPTIDRRSQLQRLQLQWNAKSHQLSKWHLRQCRVAKIHIKTEFSRMSRAALLFPYSHFTLKHSDVEAGGRSCLWVSLSVVTCVNCVGWGFFSLTHFFGESFESYNSINLFSRLNLLGGFLASLNP